MSYYHIKIRVMAHSTGESRVEDDKASGGPIQGFNVFANDFDEAVRNAKLLVSGIRTNPRVWETRIDEIVLVDA